MLKSKGSEHLVFLIFVVSLVLLFSVNSCVATDTNNTCDIVKSNLESGEITCQPAREITPSGNRFEDIQQAVFDANEGDVIILDKELYVGNGMPIYINKQVSIYGKEGITPVFDANYKSTSLVLERNAINIKIKNLEFIHGKNFAGGAIIISGHDIDIEDCTFKYNEARSGGAIYSEYAMSSDSVLGNNLRISNCYFYDNRAIIAGGAVGLFGNNTEIIDCVFKSNRAYNGDDEVDNCFGGAIQIGKFGADTVSRCINCLFVNNSAITTSEGYVSHGGAGCVREGVAYLNCTFISNKADYGGALMYHSTGTVDNCLFENNEALGLFGGALSTELTGLSSDLVIKNSIFNENRAPIGGACYLLGTDIEFNNCDFKDNFANENGGAIYIKSSSTSIYDSSFYGNIVNINGGGIYIDANSVSVYDNIFYSNKANPNPVKLDDGLGGAIYINSSQASIINNNFKYNSARNGSAVYIDKFATRTIINNNEMFENQAWVYHLPIYAPREPVLFGEEITINSFIYGGNNIANSSNIGVSNAIYNNGWTQTIYIDGINPVLGAQNFGILYQDDKEYNIPLNLKIVHENGDVVYDNTLYSNVFGNIKISFNNLSIGKYDVYVTHNEDNYYKAITNHTTFTILPKVDVQMNKRIQVPEYNYKDIIMWNLTITNNGPNRATDVIISDILPEGLIWINDNSEGKYNPVSGIFKLSELEIDQSFSLIIYTQINKTGKLVNNANVSSNEYDYNLGNNHDFEYINVNPSADLEITEIFDKKNPNYADEVYLKVLAKNNGPDNATNVRVINNLPDGLIWLSDDSDGDYNSNTGIWYLNKLNMGESRILTIKCLVNKTGKLTNVASIIADEYDWNIKNNNVSEFIEVPKAIDLEVTVGVNNSNPNYLDAIKWTIIVKNNGPDNATGVILNNEIPNGLVILTINRPDEFNNGIWTIGNLVNGESKELIIYCRVNKTGTFKNVATVWGNEYDHDDSNNNDSKSILVLPACDLEIKKSVNNKNPNYHDIIRWIIKVTNNGPDIANEVEIKEVLPDGMTIIGISESKGVFNSNTGIWNLESIAPFSSQYLNIDCRVDKTGNFTNEVSVKSNEYDYDDSNNKASSTIIVNKTIDLAVEVFVNNSNPNYKDYVLWTIKASNFGPDDATGVKVLNLIPSGLIGINRENMLDSNGIWNINILKSGETKSLNFITLVNKTGFIKNSASISGNEFESNWENNNNSKSIYIRAAADLEISKSSSKIEYCFGDIIDYSVLIWNKGPDTAHNVIVEDILEENMNFIDYCSDKGTFTNNGSLWTIDELANGQMACLTFKTIANKTGNILNKASVSCDEYDSNHFNNDISLSVLVKENDFEDNESKFKSYISQKHRMYFSDKHDSELVLKKAGSSILTLIIALCILLPFGYRYISKK